MHHHPAAELLCSMSLGSFPLAAPVVPTVDYLHVFIGPLLRGPLLMKDLLHTENQQSYDYEKDFHLDLIPYA